MSLQNPQQRVADLDGLRGWLALWVVNAHVVQFALVRESFPGNALFGLLGNGELAVAVFVILSGYVIGRQLRVAPEPYDVFVLRRFMRLYPVFLLCFAAGLAVYLNLPMFDAVKENLPDHAWLHVLMLHGAVPDTWLPSSSTAFLKPGWSVSLEWQFYLMAPFIALGLSLRRWRWGVLLGAAALVLGTGALPLDWSKPSFVLICLHLFILGMLSDRWLAAVERGRLPGDAAVRWAIIVAAGGAVALRDLPVACWLLAMLMLLPDTARAWGPVTSLWQAAMRNGVAQYLGRISYSLYLCHYLVLELVAFLAAKYLGLVGPKALPVLYLAALACIPLSDLLFRTVEMPGIRLGRRLAAQRMAATGPTALS